MDKNILKIIGLLVGLVALIAVILVVAIKGIDFGLMNAVSITGIGEKRQMVETAKDNLAKAESQYEVTVQSLEKSKKDFKTQKDAYELISDETINAIKEATKEEEYFIEYLWITLGNYATAHNLDLAIIEPNGTVSSGAASATPNGSSTTVSTGTGATVSSQSTSKDNENEEDVIQETPVTSGLTSSTDALTVQVKGNYIDLADFVFEVENDKSLRFRLDNIKMRSAGGTQVITSFNVKDFNVLKSLQSN